MNYFFNSLVASYDVNYNNMLSTIQVIIKVLLEVEGLTMIEEQKGNTNLVMRYKGYMKRLEELMQMRMNHTTAYILCKSHEVWKQTGESTFYGVLGDWKIFLWVNHGKNPRLRMLEIPALSTNISVPKSLLFTDLAIRFYHQVIDPLFSSNNAYVSV
eukprot:c17397_g2_i1 orf=115-585(+)